MKYFFRKNRHGEIKHVACSKLRGKTSAERFGRDDLERTSDELLSAERLSRSQLQGCTPIKKEGTPDPGFDRQKLPQVKTKTGYILLLTLLVISILLAIGFGIYAISIKEVVLSSFLRDSEKALAAADRGAECALYWDRSFPQNGMPYTIFATGTSYTSPSNIADAVCNNGQSDV
ncbi:MAG: hypothetical protein AAB869_02920, partial [Patescibacteria group bacterium]